MDNNSMAVKDIPTYGEWALQRAETKSLQEQVAALEAENKRLVDKNLEWLDAWNIQEAQVAVLESENIGLRILVDDWVLEVFDQEDKT